MRLNEELWVKYADWEKWYGIYICKLYSIFINIYSNIFKQKLKQKIKDNKKKMNIRATLKRIKKHLTEIKIIYSLSGESDIYLVINQRQIVSIEDIVHYWYEIGCCNLRLIR